MVFISPQVLLYTEQSGFIWNFVRQSGRKTQEKAITVHICSYYVVTDTKQSSEPQLVELK